MPNIPGAAAIVLGPSTRRQLTRFQAIGPRTHEVIINARLPLTLHRELHELVSVHPEQDWLSVLCNEMEISDAVAGELLTALCEDIPLE